MRCTCRRFGCEGSLRIRLRCFTVVPACTSPSTPSPASSVTLSRFGLVNEYTPLLLTVLTDPPMTPAPPPYDPRTPRRYVDPNRRPARPAPAPARPRPSWSPAPPRERTPPGRHARAAAPRRSRG